MCVCDVNNLSVVRGTNATFGISLSKDGESYILAENEVLVFGLKRSDRDEDRLLVKKLTNTVEGMYCLNLEPCDTEALLPGRYYYDVALQESDTVLRNVIPLSTFTLLPNAVKLGDGA